MARVAVPVTPIVRTGTGTTAPAETNGDTTNNHEVANGGNMFLLVRNSDAGGAHNVTVQTTSTVDSLAVADRVYAIPASASRYIGPFPTNTYSSLLLVDVDHATLRLSAFSL